MLFLTKIKKNLILTLVLVFQLTGICSHHAVEAKDLPQGVYNYTETVGDSVIPFNWMAKERENGVIIKVFEDQKTFFNICSADGSTVEWRLKVEGKHDIVGERNGNNLRIKGIRSGKEYDQTFTLDARPWYQPLSFSLGKFLDSEQTKTSFWVVRADTIEVLTLTAEKLGDEMLRIGNTPVNTQKVEIRAEGFKSKFWHATYWYRKADNLFVRYQSVHGLPGTAETIVELVKSPSGQFDS